MCYISYFKRSKYRYYLIIWVFCQNFNSVWNENSSNANKRTNEHTQCQKNIMRVRFTKLCCHCSLLLSNAKLLYKAIAPTYLIVKLIHDDSLFFWVSQTYLSIWHSWSKKNCFNFLVNFNRIMAPKSQIVFLELAV